MRKGMDRICQHCGELFVGNTYRVTSEEKGITLLNLVFVPFVLWKPNGFGSIRRKSIPQANKFHLEAEGVTIRDSTINFNTGSFTRGNPQAHRRACERSSSRKPFQPLMRPALDRGGTLSMAD